MARRRRRRNESPEEEIAKAIYLLLVLFIGYLAILFYTNRPEFYRWIGYAVGLIIIVAAVTVGWVALRGYLKEARIKSLLDRITSRGLEHEINNFISRFGRGQERSNNAWEYRGYRIDWSRFNEVLSNFNRKGVRMNHKDFSAILKYYIDQKESEFTFKSIQAPTYIFSSLTGSTFEDLVKRLYENMGYVAQRTGRSGDQGGDIVAIKGSDRLLIQAKRYLENSVGNSAVQEAAAAMKLYDCNKGLVVTTSQFTPAAYVLARANEIELIDKSQLQTLLLEHLGEKWS